jgi:nitroreductase
MKIIPSPPMTNPSATPVDLSTVDAAIASRRSVRAFLSTPVPVNEVEAILRTAARAPSGTNTQPWKVHVLTGAAKQRLIDAVMQVWNDPEQLKLHTEEYAYYPRQWVSPYIDRRRKVGWDLYSLLGIGKTDKVRMHAQHGRNFQFFDAPVGLIFSIDRVMERGSWMDYGMFLQNIMVAARGRGLDTCPQAAWTQFHRIIAKELNFSADEMLVCGMALGFADNSKIENTLITERADVAEFAKFLDR